MDKQTSTVKTRPNNGETRCPISSNPLFEIETDKTAKNGMKTAVKMKPIMAGMKKSPASIPRNGGKIKLPAPKNKENNINPKMNIFLADNGEPP